MFGAMSLERDPLRYQDVPAMLLSWVQDAGGFAMVAIILWLLIGYPFMRPVDRARIPGWQSTIFLVCVIAAPLFYLMYAGGVIWEWASGGEEGAGKSLAMMRVIQEVGLGVGGGLAILAVGLPFLRGLLAVRFRRVFALAKLSFKEALRRRVLWIFAFFLLVILFGSWFIHAKPEDQVRSYVSVVSTAMTFLLLITAFILASFSIPTDIKQQTIHTIITKPVERFEVVMGRFLGFMALMTVVLLVMTAVSLLYILRGINPDAAAESLKARQPLYGDLRFENTTSEKKGINVGREWGYLGYISGKMPGQPQEYAVWGLPAPSQSVASRPTVRCEFSFDIYRTTKGYEGQGVSCGFAFQTWRFDRNKTEEYRERRKEERSKRAGRTDMDIDNELAEKYGYFEVQSKEIVDFHTQYIDLPGGLFRNALGSDDSRKRPTDQPPVLVRVKCNSMTQYVGMAKYSLYLRNDNPEGGADQFWFAVNFVKGSAGVWLQLCLVVGLAVTLSTYLSGVISMLVATLIYVGGAFQEFIKSVATGTNVGGGPFEALYRLASRETTAAPLAETTTTRVATVSDIAFRWFFRRLLNVLPDIDRLNLSAYVQDGFDISGTQLALSLLQVFGYLLPWAALGYYLIKWREIASTN
jgi:ABC-type transport system involved in multi-copper enzyme maturation permease subunit